MSAGLFLTAAEIKKLTELKRPSAQIKWLTCKGWVFEISDSNRPVVLRSYAERRMSGQQPPGPGAPSTQPAFEALKKHGKAI